ncbi:hypothetical protein [Nocardiopsis alborubida]|uniref:hypothetical protein n=1 Tax=Nocardiopsis alborubida TaxID=146802 RepID=UPI000AF7BBB2|nr:hypothetical protein [Nocardiopsis alborubida]
MELTLSGGYNVILTSDMCRSIRLAAPLGARRDVWCPDVREPGEGAPLIAQGPAERDARGLLVLTERGVQARSMLLPLAGLVGEPGREGRPTLDPSLPEERARRLRLALDAVRGGRARHQRAERERDPVRIVVSAEGSSCPRSARRGDPAPPGAHAERRGARLPRPGPGAGPAGGRARRRPGLNRSRAGRPQAEAGPAERRRSLALSWGRKGAPP